MTVVGDAPVTLLAVQERLVGVHGLWRRTPGDGRSPFACDGPWHLMLREVGDIVGHYSETLLTNAAGKEMQVRKVDQSAPRTPLRTAEVAERDLVTGWLTLLAEPLDRKVVWLATAHLARGEDAPGWTEIKRITGAVQGPSALAWRYRKALAALVCRLHGLPSRDWRGLVARDGAALTSAARQESLGCGAVKW